MTASSVTCDVSAVVEVQWNECSHRVNSVTQGVGCGAGGGLYEFYMVYTKNLRVLIQWINYGIDP